MSAPAFAARSTASSPRRILSDLSAAACCWTSAIFIAAIVRLRPGAARSPAVSPDIIPEPYFLCPAQPHPYAPFPLPDTVSAMLRRMKQLLAAMGLLLLAPLPAAAADAVATKAGPIQGITEADGLRVFKGIPFAAPPIGPLRWQPPHPVAKWKDVRQTTALGAQCMQRRIYGDMIFRAAGNSEDCLFLNVWTPAKTGREPLPALVRFLGGRVRGGRLPALACSYGGGSTAGDGWERRYEGAAMARRGIVALTVNYRLGVFGFMAHPDLTKESARHASGTYGPLDPSAR